jgi:hypothetical protein
MRKSIGRAALAAAVTGFVLVQPSQAAAACWGPQEAAAAKVRDLQSRLMVATLRCRAMGYDMLASYNDFVNANRDTLQAANGVIKAQFETGAGADGETLYDHFITALANAYGGDATSEEICEATSSAAGDGAAAAGDATRLVAIADRFGRGPDLPSGECPITFSSR